MSQTKRILIFGHTGWIGTHLFNIFDNINSDNIKNIKYKIIKATARLDNLIFLPTYLNEYKNVDYVILAAGLTGRPNIDWCEDHKEEVMTVNVVGPSIIAKFCNDNNIHLTYLGTGCIYEYDKDHQINDDKFKGFTEEDKPNYDNSWYSFTKIMTENLMKTYNALILRFRMPISDDLHHRSLVTKIIKYERVINVPNSMTIISDLVPLIPKMMEKSLTGVYNFTNPGVISHNQILEMYIDYIDPDFTYSNFTVEEQAKILKSGRSNNKLDISKLLSEFPDIPHIEYSIIKVFERMSSIINTDKWIHSDEPEE